MLFSYYYNRFCLRSAWVVYTQENKTTSGGNLLNQPGHTSIVQALLSRENYPQSSPQILRMEAHDL